MALTSHKAMYFLKYEVTGLKDFSREIEVRFWWKKRLRRLALPRKAGGLSGRREGQSTCTAKFGYIRKPLNL
jgi:hypothetical protein